MLAMASIAVAFMERPATLHRYGPTLWLDGRALEATPTATAIAAVIRPPSEAMIRNLAEGERSEGTVAIWSRTELRASSEETQVRADEVEQAGVRYRIMSIETRAEGGFWRAMGRRVGPS
jgi:hypothetical protein